MLCNMSWSFFVVSRQKLPTSWHFAWEALCPWATQVKLWSRSIRMPNFSTWHLQEERNRPFRCFFPTYFQRYPEQGWTSFRSSDKKVSRRPILSEKNLELCSWRQCDDASLFRHVTLAFRCHGSSKLSSDQSRCCLGCISLCIYIYAAHIYIYIYNIYTFVGGYAT